MALFQRSNRPCSAAPRNFLAIAIATATVGFGYINFDPANVGGDPSGRRPGAGVLMADTIPLTPLEEFPAGQAPAGNGLDGDVTAASEGPMATTRVLTGRWALRLTTEMLRRGCESFERIEDYTADMCKQERIGGALSEVQEIELKVAHAPFSVYMKWITGDRGRQLIYVDGKNDNQLLVQLGGIPGRIAGLRSLDPQSALAMAESRHPVTKVGLVALAKTLLEYQMADLERGSGFKCQLEDGHEFDGRPCFLYVCEYENASVCDVYRKSVVMIDKEHSLPVCVKNYTWGEDVSTDRLDEETLVELYSYANLKVKAALEQSAFAEDNPEYKLRVRR